MSKVFSLILCVGLVPCVISGCQKTDDASGDSAPTATRAQADGLTQVPGQQPGSQTPNATSNTGATASPQGSTNAADSKDDH